MFKPTGSPTDTPPAGYESQLDMKGRILYWILMQGLGVAVLAAWVWLQQMELRDYKASVRNCNEQLIQAYQEQNVKLINALEDINHTLDKLQSSPPTRKRY
jgi:hypothetical protein